MGIINKIFSSVNGLYNNINPITLSGVNDVIVVRDRDGVLRCSPFQLRFSRLHFSNARAKTVQLYINGALTDISMTITSQGDLFFEQQRANDAVDYERVVEYLRSNEVSIGAILSRRIEVPRRPSAEPCLSSACDCVLNVSMDDSRINHRSMSITRHVTPGFSKVCVHTKESGSPSTEKLAEEIDIFIQKERIDNLNKRLFAKNNRIRYYDEMYAPLALTYYKMSALLNSAEHFASVLEKQKLFLYLMESLIANRDVECGGASLSFSSCLSSKIERTVDETFMAYLVKEIDDPENTVVKIEATIGSRGSYTSRAAASRRSSDGDRPPDKMRASQAEGVPNQTSKDRAGCPEGPCDKSGFNANDIYGDGRGVGCSSRDGLFNQQFSAADRAGSLDSLYTLGASMDADTMVPAKVSRFYLPYKTFTKLFFELRQTRNRFGLLVEFLEKEHNRALGWNIFGTKQPIKSDIGFSLELNSEELAMLRLRPGKNDVVFKISGQQRQLEGNIYLWDADDKVVVSDIDGTITKSDLLGHLYAFVGRDWTHNGVAALFTRIVKNGYRMLYLTSRSLGQSSGTRSYLRAIDQDSFRLPEGPVIHSPDGLFRALYREVIVKRPEEFKIHCLSTIQGLFGGANPFLAGFGNRVSDAYTYKVLGIPNNRIYTINRDGQLIAEYTQSLVGTYHTMNEFIDSIFPSLNAGETGENDHRFSDFAWWRM